MVHRTGRVAHDHLDFVVGHIQFFRDDLANGHIQTLAQVHLAVISRHFAIGLNGHPRVEFVGFECGFDRTDGRSQCGT